MDFITTILPYTVSIGTFIAGLFTGRRKRDNDFISELQKSIDLLSLKNRELMEKIISLREENTKLLINQEEMKVEIKRLRDENAQLRKEVEELNVKLTNVKTITRKA